MGYEWDDYSKIVRHGKDDKPNKYGFTKKMNDILDLVEDGKKLEDGGFDIGDADEDFYDHYKWLFDREKKIRGKAYHFPRYHEE